MQLRLSGVSAAREGDASLGKDYLEKLCRSRWRPTALRTGGGNVPESSLADLRLDTEQMRKGARCGAGARRTGQFAVAMNYGIAQGCLGISDELQADFTIANRSHRRCVEAFGQPSTAEALSEPSSCGSRPPKAWRDARPAILAKLMVLERNDKNSTTLPVAIARTVHPTNWRWRSSINVGQPSKESRRS